jgi:hypothetical protein
MGALVEGRRSRGEGAAAAMVSIADSTQQVEVLRGGEEEEEGQRREAIKATQRLAYKA